MEDKQPEAAEKAKDPKVNAYDWIESLVTAIVACILIFLFLFRVVNVQGSSMVPTLRESDKIVISRLARDFQYGDIVVLTKTAFDDDSIVKRVIATEGQTIDIDFDEGIVQVDGVVLQEPYIAEKTTKALDFRGPVTVPEGCIFCMGDNRNQSTDSRRTTIGMIDTRCVLGRVVLRLWPLNKFGTVK
jgi:signal peptidase I